MNKDLEKMFGMLDFVEKSQINRRQETVQLGEREYEMVIHKEGKQSFTWGGKTIETSIILFNNFKRILAFQKKTEQNGEHVSSRYQVREKVGEYDIFIEKEEVVDAPYFDCSNIHENVRIYQPDHGYGVVGVDDYIFYEEEDGIVGDLEGREFRYNPLVDTCYVDGVSYGKIKRKYRKMKEKVQEEDLEKVEYVEWDTERKMEFLKIAYENIDKGKMLSYWSNFSDGDIDKIAEVAQESLHELSDRKDTSWYMISKGSEQKSSITRILSKTMKR